MRFLIDAQLPPGLADKLQSAGHQAEHVSRIGLLAASDVEVWRVAKRQRVTLITKDQDFIGLQRSDKSVAIVWIRLGNVTNAMLWRRLEPKLQEILDALAAGETLIEVI